jgi:integrase
MASFRKKGRSWEAQVARQGIRKSASFATKAEAQAWAAKTETEIRSGRRGDIPDKTFGQLLEKYRDEVSASKKGERWERVRIDRMVGGRPKDDPPVPADPITGVRLADLSETDFAGWRDRRLREVSAGSVRREWTLLSHACTVAINEWRWLREHPMQKVRRPAPPPSRDRIFTDDEITRLLFALGYCADRPPDTQTSRVGAALLFAVETAMRAGEICALRWPDIDQPRRFLRIRAEDAGSGKTAAARREVPLSAEALRIIAQLEGVKKDDATVFQISSTQTLDALFRKAKARACIEGLHFHDSRATAITRLAKKLDILSLARMVGHRDLRMLQVYYRETAEELAARL